MDAKPSASAVVVDGGRFLVVRRARPPQEGGWDVPGGFCDADDPADAARREVQEETGLEVVVGDVIGLYRDDYDFQGEQVPTLNIYFLAHLTNPAATAVADPDEVSEVAWFDLADPPPLAFGHQDVMIREVPRRLAFTDPWDTADAARQQATAAGDGSRQALPRGSTLFGDEDSSDREGTDV